METFTDAPLRELAMPLPSQPTAASEALYEHAMRFHDAFAYATIGMALVGLDGQLQHVNAALCEMLGYSADELHSMTLQALTHPDDLEKSRALGDALLEGAIPAYQLEKRYIHRSGDTVHVLLAVSLVRASDDTPRYFVVQFQNMSAHKQVLAALEASEARFRALVEQLPAMIYTAAIDPQSSTTYTSPQVHEILGFTPEEWEADPELWLRQMHPDDRPHVLAEVEEAQVSDGSTSAEYRAITRDGREIWVQDIARVVRDAEGKPLFLQGITFDITARKRIEQELAEERARLEQRVAERTADLQAANTELMRALRLKDEFLTTISHELRTPLIHVIGLAEGLREVQGAALNPQQEHMVARIEMRSRRLLEIINNVLDIARIGAGELALTREPVLATDLVASCLQRVRAAASQKLLVVETEIDPRVRTVRGDGRRLKQILGHLLTNAVAFTPPEGTIGVLVTGDESRDVVRFTVWDTGVGIASDQQGRLFQPFVQLDGDLAREHEGLGLGLALVQRLAALHGGDVTVASEPGRGSRFTVTLPWRRAAQDEDDASAPAD